MREMRADLVVAGGSLGGVAAALAACRRGHRVVLIEETDWLGGQLTSQAVPPDEHPWIEQFGCTASYRRLRQDIRSYYRTWYPLTQRARTWRSLNPGAARVSGLSHEPRVRPGSDRSHTRPARRGATPDSTAQPPRDRRHTGR